MKLAADRFGTGESLDETKRVTQDTILSPEFERRAGLWKFGRGRGRAGGEGRG